MSFREYTESSAVSGEWLDAKALTPGARQTLDVKRQISNSWWMLAVDVEAAISDKRWFLRHDRLAVSGGRLREAERQRVGPKSPNHICVCIYI